MASVLERVRILLTSQDSPSRNLNYSEFSDEEGKQVFRLYRLYLSLLREVDDAAGKPEVTVRLLGGGQGLRLEISDAKLSYRRTCVVPPELAQCFSERLASLGLAAG